MNILFLTKEIPFPPNNGHRNRTFHLLRGLAKKHSVTLVCFGAEYGDTERAEGVKEFCKSVRIITQENMKVGFRLALSVLLGLFSLFPYVVKSRYSTRMKKTIADILNQVSFDYIICDSIYQAVHLQFDNKIIKILAEHNIESLIIQRYLMTEKNLIKKIYASIEFLKFKRFENKFWPRFDLCLAVSEVDKHRMQVRSSQQNIRIIPNGVDTDYFSFNRAKEKPGTILYMGQMNWHPNIDAIIYFFNQIFPLVRNEEPNLSLYIIGKDPPRNLKKLLEKNNAKVTGFVEDVRSYIEEGEVFIVPLRIGSGTRLKILEAMAMGKAVVSTTIGCEGLEVTDGENILIADKPTDFALKIIELLRNSSLREQLGIAARKLVEERYSWDKVIEKLNTAL